MVIFRVFLNSLSQNVKIPWIIKTYKWILLLYDILYIYLRVLKSWMTSFNVHHCITFLKLRISIIRIYCILFKYLSSFVYCTIILVSVLFLKLGYRLFLCTAIKKSIEYQSSRTTGRINRYCENNMSSNL